MRVIGITGGVGSGKSTILEYVRNKYNCEIILADDLAKSLCLKGEVCFEPLLEVLGYDCIAEDGEIDRAKMAQKIFADKTVLEKVNSIIHPAVKEYILNWIKEGKEKDTINYYFLEAALLIEDGYKEIVDELWYIYSDASVRRERLKKSRGYTDLKIDSIMKSQLSDSVYRENCDFVIDNSGNPEDSFRSIDERMASYGGAQ